MPAAEITLALYVVTLGIAVGGGLYEARVIVPLWYRGRNGDEPVWDAQCARTADPDRRFWMYVTTIPLTVLTVASLVLAFQLNDPRRTCWLAAAGVILLERIATFTYFMPSLQRLQEDEFLRPEAARVMVSWWILLNWMRNLTYAACWLAALLAFALDEPPPPP